MVYTESPLPADSIVPSCAASSDSIAIKLKAMMSKGGSIAQSLPALQPTDETRAAIRKLGQQAPAQLVKAVEGAPANTANRC